MYRLTPILFLCLRALPLLYPAAPPSVFAYEIGKYTAPAVALVREYVVELQGVLSGFLRSKRVRLGKRLRLDLSVA